jgi:23S rRNA pseudouridine1911/1915/1917 synthase
MILTTTADDAGQRLDVWLEHQLDDLSRARIQSLIRAGNIRVDDRVVKPNQKIADGMRVSIDIPPPEPTDLQAEDIPLDIIHEDPDILVVNKPPGLVVHPAAGHPDGTLVNAVLHHCPDLGPIGGELRPGIVHRLDRDTSGVMVVAKNEIALNAIVNQFKEGGVSKEYTAIVHGCPREPEGRIETLIGRSRQDRKLMSARPASGRQAVTTYKVVKKYFQAASLRVHPETGRTHQIRVHLAHIGCPIVGDKQYGGRRREISAPRQMLHARRLAFQHPTSGEKIKFSAPLPPDMTALLQELGDQAS